MISAELLECLMAVSPRYYHGKMERKSAALHTAGGGGGVLSQINQANDILQLEISQQCQVGVLRDKKAIVVTEKRISI